MLIEFCKVTNKIYFFGGCMKPAHSTYSLFKKTSSLFPFICAFLIIWVFNTFVIPGQLYECAVYLPFHGGASRWFVVFSDWFFHMGWGLGNNVLVAVHIFSNCYFIHLISTVLDSQWGKWPTIVVFVLPQVILRAVLILLDSPFGITAVFGTSSFGISGMMGAVLAYCLFNREFWDKWKVNWFFRWIPAWLIIGIIMSYITNGDWSVTLLYIVTIILGFAFCFIIHKRIASAVNSS